MSLLPEEVVLHQLQHADEVERPLDGCGEGLAAAWAANHEHEAFHFGMRPDIGGSLLQHLERRPVGRLPAADAQELAGAVAGGANRGLHGSKDKPWQGSLGEPGAGIYSKPDRR